MQGSPIGRMHLVGLEFEDRTCQINESTPDLVPYSAKHEMRCGPALDGAGSDGCGFLARHWLPLPPIMAPPTQPHQGASGGCSWVPFPKLQPWVPAITVIRSRMHVDGTAIGAG